MDDSGASASPQAKVASSAKSGKAKPATTDRHGHYTNCIVCNDWFLKKTRADGLKCDAQTLQLDYYIVDC